MAVMKIGANVIKIYNMDLEKLGGCASPKLKHFSNTGDRGGKVGSQVLERSESIRGRKKHRIDMGPSKKKTPRMFSRHDGAVFIDRLFGW